MAPKKKKKTKEELEEERRLAEEAARLAEEGELLLFPLRFLPVVRRHACSICAERRRLEEEERKRLEELERQRQELLATLMAGENERCEAEK